MCHHQEKNKNNILGCTRLLLRSINLYNKNGVYIKFNRKLFSDSVKIPDSFVFCIISFPTFWYAFLLFWAIIEERFNLQLVSTSLTGAIAALQTSIIYLALAMRTDLIISTVDNLQEAVEKSW